MATIKSYTDLPQSRKLAEILPLESADMYYLNGDAGKISIGEWENNVHDEDDIPCWSLAALLSIIKPVNDNSYTLKGTLNGGAMISFEEVTSVIFLEDEIIDAVFEMICWLKENNKL